jgi:hypothetical protein
MRRCRLLITFMHDVEPSESFGDGCNEHLSGRYRGACWLLFNDDDCSRACKDESSDNVSGGCDLFQCWCYTKCQSKIVAAPPGTPILPWYNDPCLVFSITEQMHDSM